jgi:hypothetical protein
MGIIRGGLLVIASVLFFVSLLAGNFFLTMNLSLDYEIIKPELISTIKQMAEKENNVVPKITDEHILKMEEYCKNNSNFIYVEGDYAINISCSNVLEGSEAIVEEGVENIVEELYYKNYDCGFFDCVKNDPSFFFSEQLKNSSNSKFYFMLMISIVIFIIMFFLTENKSNSFILAGILLIISALPFAKLDSVISLFDKGVMKVFTVFFVKGYVVFLRMLFIGIGFLIFGVVLKFFGIGFKISEFMNKFKKNPNAQVQSQKAPLPKSAKKNTPNFLQKIVPKKIIPKVSKSLKEKKE